jgi:type VI secretion system protein ImpC
MEDLREFVRLRLPGVSTSGELPFTIAVLQNFFPGSTRKELSDRKLIDLERAIPSQSKMLSGDDFSDLILDHLLDVNQPLLSFSVLNPFNDDQVSNVSITFKSLSDFDPNRVLHCSFFVEDSSEIPISDLVAYRTTLKSLYDECRINDLSAKYVYEKWTACLQSLVENHGGLRHWDYFSCLASRLESESQNLNAGEKLILEIHTLDQLFDDLLCRLFSIPGFVDFETTWKSLRYLLKTVTESGPDSNAIVKVKILDITADELADEMDYHDGLGESKLVDLLCDQEIGTTGGDPIGLLLYDSPLTNGQITQSEVRHRFEIVRFLADVADKACFSVLLNLDPHLIDNCNWDPFKFRSSEFMVNKTLLKWRDNDELGTVSFCGPLFEIRPRLASSQRYSKSALDSQSLHDDLGLIDPLMASGIYLVAQSLIESYRVSGWFAPVKMTSADSNSSFQGQYSEKLSVHLTSEHIREMKNSGLNFISKEYGEFSPVLEQIEVFDHAPENNNLRLRERLCAQRFTQYVYQYALFLSGGNKSPSEIQREVTIWLNSHVAEYCMTPSQRIAQPLKSAIVEVNKAHGSLGLQMSISIVPAYGFSELEERPLSLETMMTVLQ